MNVLYLTNYPVPYRVEFFNQLADAVDLTVWYESSATDLRDEEWQHSNAIRHCCLTREDASLGKLLRCRDFDLVVVGCYNEHFGLEAIMRLKMAGRKYVINVDGEYFDGPGIKKRIRDLMVKDADGYLIAGEKTGAALRRLVGEDKVRSYHFSSLCRREVEQNASERWREGESYLCVGQYAQYKGLDVLVDAFVQIPDEKLTIIGSSSKTDELRAYIDSVGACNIDVVPFLQKEELGCRYRNCKAFILPSRQECWGLVMNEAASFGAPIIATRGVGAARDFLVGNSPLLVNPESPRDLVRAVSYYGSLDAAVKTALSDDLLVRSSGYTIERTVEEHTTAFGYFLQNC